MTEYISGLGSDARVGDVFFDLYEQVDRGVSDLDHLRRGDSEVPTGQRHVPGTHLEMDWTELPGDEPTVTFATTEVDTWPPLIPKKIPLLSRTERVDDTSREPSHINAHRACEPTGDYSLANGVDRLGRQRIVVNLGSQGVRRTRIPVVEPFGKDYFSPTQKVGTLNATERERLEVVSVGILDNLGIIELLKEGEPTEVVFDLMGRPQFTR